VQECKYEVVVSLLTLLEERDKAACQNDHARVGEVVHDLVEIFPPDIDPTAQDSLYVHLYLCWRLPHTQEALDFETHVYATNAVAGIDIVYCWLFAVFIAFHGSSHDEGVLFDVFLCYHYTRYIHHEHVNVGVVNVGVAAEIAIMHGLYSWHKRVEHYTNLMKRQRNDSDASTTADFTASDGSPPLSPAFPLSPPTSLEEQEKCQLEAKAEQAWREDKQWQQHKAQQ
jgi:hypothetical protein